LYAVAKNDHPWCVIRLSDGRVHVNHASAWFGQRLQCNRPKALQPDGKASVA
jgi:hypothetical protein